MRLHLPRDRNLIVLFALLVIATSAYFGVRNSNGYTGGIAELDGFYYYVYLRSLQMDGDLDFSNEYRDWGNPFDFGYTSTGRARNIFGVGPAVLWSPFFLAACGLARLGVALGYPLSLDGLSPFHQSITLWGTLFYGWLALLFCYLIARQLFGREHALWPTLGAGLAGPLPFYCLMWASYSHAQAAMATSLMILLWLRWRESWTLRRWILFGAAAGLVVLVRTAAIAFLLLPLFEAGRQLRAAARREEAGGSRAGRILRALAAPLAGGLAAILVFTPQLIAWRVLYGRLLLIPQGESFMVWGENAWAETLFSPRNGLLTMAPLMLFALIGLFAGVRRRPAVGGPLLLVFLGVLVVNGAAYDWWGWGFSARRYTCSMPLFTFGLAAVLRGVRERLLRNAARSIAWVTAIVILAFITFNLQWVSSFAQKNLDWYYVRSTEGLYMTVTHGAMERVYNTIGNPLSLPASLNFSIRRGGSPRVYDRIDGSYLLGEAHPQANPAAKPYMNATLDFGDLRFRHNLSEAFGYPIRNAEGIRYAPLRQPRAHIFLPLNRPGGVQLTLGGRAAHAGTRLEVRFNGKSLGTRPLPHDEWSLMAYDIPRSWVVRGINRVDLIHELPQVPEDERCLVSGGKRVCSRADLAAISGGPSAGLFAEIYLDDKRVAPSWRGLNVAVVEPSTGKLLGARGFDTILYLSMYRELDRYLRCFPAGSLVAFAARGDPTRNLLRGGREALARFGVTGEEMDAEGGFAAIGVLGGAPGTALEASAKLDHARVHLGKPPTSWRELAQYRLLRLR